MTSVAAGDVALAAIPGSDASSRSTAASPRRAGRVDEQHDAGAGLPPVAASMRSIATSESAPGATKPPPLSS